MIEILKILHLVALMFGAAASFGNLYILLAKGAHDLPAPGFVNRLRLLFRLTALFAILTLFATGLLLMLAKYGIWIEGTAFSVKLFFATVILLIVLYLNVIFPRIARPGSAPPGYVAYLHLVAAFSLIASVIFAVIGFA